ncbi:MAG: hypothetical protein AAF378_08670 [Cyanobacteria bacterium P01_A01_bin.84]
MKLANPLNYPIAVLIGGITLVIGIRFIKLPSLVMIPLSTGIAGVGAVYLKSREPESLGLDNPQLERELQKVKERGINLAQKAQELRTEATKLLTDAMQMELLVAVQYGCDRAVELPSKIDDLARRLQGKDSLLSVSDLQEQLRDVENKLKSSSGIAKNNLNQLAKSLERNIKLARQGEDARQAQVINLSQLVQDSAGILQQLQNQMRTADLSNLEQVHQLESFSKELNSLQENVQILVDK